MSREVKHLTLETATKFFSEFYFGEHHIPGHKIHKWGYGFRVKHDRGALSSFDFNELTRLVLMAHKYCVRVSVSPLSFRFLSIEIWQRQGTEGSLSERHPKIEQAIESFNLSSK